MGGFVAVYNYLGYRLLAEPFSLPLAVAVSSPRLPRRVGLLRGRRTPGRRDRASPGAGRRGPGDGRGAGPHRFPTSWCSVVLGLVVFTTGFFAAQPSPAAGCRSSRHRTGPGAARSTCAATTPAPASSAPCSGSPGRRRRGPVAAGVGVLVALALVATAAVVRGLPPVVRRTGPAGPRNVSASCHDGVTGHVGWRPSPRETPGPRAAADRACPRRATGDTRSDGVRLLRAPARAHRVLHARRSRSARERSPSGPPSWACRRSR